MPTKYHLTPKGEAAPCRAQTKCPFGDLEKEHYPTAEEAQAAFERQMESKGWAKVSKKDQHLANAKFELEAAGVPEATISSLIENVTLGDKFRDFKAQVDTFGIPLKFVSYRDEFFDNLQEKLAQGEDPLDLVGPSSPEWLREDLQAFCGEFFDTPQKVESYRRWRREDKDSYNALMRVYRSDVSHLSQEEVTRAFANLNQLKNSLTVHLGRRYRPIKAKWPRPFAPPVIYQAYSPASLEAAQARFQEAQARAIQTARAGNYAVVIQTDMFEVDPSPNLRGVEKIIKLEDRDSYVRFFDSKEAFLNAIPAGLIGDSANHGDFEEDDQGDWDCHWHGNPDSPIQTFTKVHVYDDTPEAAVSSEG